MSNRVKATGSNQQQSKRNHKEALLAQPSDCGYMS